MGKYLKIEESSGRPRRLHTAMGRLRSAIVRLQLNDAQDLVGSHPSLPTQADISLQAIINISSEALGEEIRRASWTISVFPPKPNTFSEEAACIVSKEPASVVSLK
jgi:hypothetical protein